MNIDELFARLSAENPEIAEVAHEVDPPFVLASNVIETRTARGITSEQLAERAGLTLPQVWRIERGDSNPRLLTLAKIAHVLDLTLPELLEDRL